VQKWVLWAIAPNNRAAEKVAHSTSVWRADMSALCMPVF